MIQDEIRTKTLSFITAAFGLVAGLAWNDAIKALIEYLFPLDKDSLLAQFTYAIVLTIILVIVTIYLSRIFKKQEDSNQERAL